MARACNSSDGTVETGRFLELAGQTIYLSWQSSRSVKDSITKSNVEHDWGWLSVSLWPSHTPPQLCVYVYKQTICDFGNLILKHRLCSMIEDDSINLWLPHNLSSKTHLCTQTSENFWDLFDNWIMKHGLCKWKYHVSVTPDRRVKKRKCIITQVKQGIRKDFNSCGQRT